MNTKNKRHSSSDLSSKKIILFKAISILLPLLVVGGIEFLLRTFQYGYDLRLFTEYPDDSNFLVLNPNASRKYFVNQQIATTGNVEPFRKVKAKNTVRIFILGESTTIGYPYFHNGSFHRWLQYRLTREHPNTTFEIINLSLTAVNSYTVFGFAKELVDYEPDAVLVYTGHNEYYGALGVGSTEQIGGNAQLVDLILYARQFRLVQGMTNAYDRLRRLMTTPADSAGGTRMKLMVADQQIPYGSDLYERGVAQFRRNMDRTLSLLADHQIPVFVSTLASNEKSIKPFVSFSDDAEKKVGFAENFSLGQKEYYQGKYEAARAHLLKANQLYNGHALCNFYLGNIACRQRDDKQAKHYFSTARDLDGLRFRAPTVFNQLLADLCGHYPTAHLVDTQALFERDIPDHIVGDELMLEHVHPNLRGYALMSEAFYQALQKQSFMPATSPAQAVSFATLLRDMPITSVDSLVGLYKVAHLKQNWPFREVMTSDVLPVESVIEKLAYGITTQRMSWPDALGNLYEHYMRSRQLVQARKVVEAFTLEYPIDTRYFTKAAMLSGELGDEASAIFYFKKAFALAPSFESARYLFALYLKHDQPADALPYLDYAIAHNTAQFNLQPVKTYATQIVELQRAYAHDSTNVPVLTQIASAYYHMENKDGAAKYLRKVLAIDAKNQDARALMAQLN